MVSNVNQKGQSPIKFYHEKREKRREARGREEEI